MKVALTALAAFLISFPAFTLADAIMYVSPEKGTYTLGQVFEVKIYADTGGTLVNAAEGNIAYDTEALEVTDISTEDSILESWSTPPSFSNEEGVIHFAGWTRKNYSGSNGLLITVTFKTKRNMVGNARLAAGAILAADGQESNIITGMRSGVFKIEAPRVVEVPAQQEENEADATATSSSEIMAKVPPPVFDDVPDAVSIGDHIIIRGNTEPSAHVYVYLTRGTETEKRTEILSASDGSFTYVSDEAAVEGVYHLRASVATDDGRQSSQSDTVDIIAAPTGVAASAVFGVSLAFELIPFLALLIFGGLGAAYIYHRHQLAKMHYGRSSVFDSRQD